MYNQLKSNDSRFEAYIQRFLVLTIHFQFYHTQDAIASSTAAPGYSCYRLEFYQADPLVSEAACRGDNQAAYFKAKSGGWRLWWSAIVGYWWYIYIYCDFDGGLFIGPLATHKTGYRKDQLNTNKKISTFKMGIYPPVRTVIDNLPPNEWGSQSLESQSIKSERLSCNHHVKNPKPQTTSNFTIWSFAASYKPYPTGF